MYEREFLSREGGGCIYKIENIKKKTAEQNIKLIQRIKRIFQKITLIVTIIYFN